MLSGARDDGRPACVNCGQCHQGCRTGAKTSMEVTSLPEAVRAGAEIRADSFVHGIELDTAGRVCAVVYTSGGVEHRQRCSALFLCAGGVETPRLLLHTGLANSSGQVGRNFLAHGATQVWGTFESEMRGYRGYPSSAMSEETVRPVGADFAGGYLIQSLGVMPLTYATALARGGGLWGRELMEALDGYRYAAGVGINAECLPADGNRLELTDELDEHGVPKARVTFSAGATSTRVLARTAHTLGTVRMGTRMLATRRSTPTAVASTCRTCGCATPRCSRAR